jgi:hypothetical protein
MTWIKRNLIFLIIALVGVLLTGWAVWSWMSVRDEDNQAKTDFEAVMNELNGLRTMNPYPTPENIEAAKAEAAQMRGLLVDFQKVFAPFPAAVPMDEKTFAAELSRHVAVWQNEAKIAAVKLPTEDYGFSFDGLRGLLSFPSNCIPVWQEQFSQVNNIIDFVLRSHVNEVTSLMRVPVYPGDQGGPNFVQTTWVTNNLGVVSPYQIDMVCFSRDLASLLEAFDNATNCYVVRSVTVRPTTNLAGQPGAPGVSAAEQQRFRLPVQPTRPGAPGAKGPTGVTIIRERPLFVSVVVDAIQLKPAKP